MPTLAKHVTTAMTTATRNLLGVVGMVFVRLALGKPAKTVPIAEASVVATKISNTAAARTSAVRTIGVLQKVASGSAMKWKGALATHSFSLPNHLKHAETTKRIVRGTRIAAVANAFQRKVLAAGPSKTTGMPTFSMQESMRDTAFEN
jgi:hypothetical protein